MFGADSILAQIAIVVDREGLRLALSDLLIGARESETPMGGVLDAALLGVELHPGRRARRVAGECLCARGTSQNLGLAEISRGGAFLAVGPRAGRSVVLSTLVLSGSSARPFRGRSPALRIRRLVRPVVFV